jgi:DNA-binding HxlR family transcriptional regulator
MKQSNLNETVVDNQLVIDKKKMENIFSDFDLENPPTVCPIRDVLANVLDKWSILIILMLGYYEILRFADLKKKIKGISPKMLSISLKHLEKDGFIIRTAFAEVPLREYSGQTEPLNPGQTEPVIPGQSEPLIPVKLSHLRV